MATVHDEFYKALKELGFKRDNSQKYDYVYTDGTWFYKVNFEGYAYVLYKEINIYRKPLTNLFRIYNKFKKGDAQIGLHYAVPIAQFREPQKLIDLMNIIRIDEQL